MRCITTIWFAQTDALILSEFGKCTYKRKKSRNFSGMPLQLDTNLPTEKLTRQSISRHFLLHKMLKIVEIFGGRRGYRRFIGALPLIREYAHIDIEHHASSGIGANVT